MSEAAYECFLAQDDQLDYHLPAYNRLYAICHHQIDSTTSRFKAYYRRQFQGITEDYPIRPIPRLLQSSSRTLDALNVQQKLPKVRSCQHHLSSLDLASEKVLAKVRPTRFMK